MLHPGANVDRYIVESLLGRGGMAEVWAVRHKVLGTRRALKVLAVRGPDLVERLLEEGRVQARLEHAHVLPVLDVVEVEGAPALVLPLVVGAALDDALKRVRLTEEEVIAVVSGIARGLSHAHRLGVAHRDVKPANVLLALQGERLVPRVADFGLAKALDPGLAGPTRSGAMLGTPAYAAPEQLLDAASADHRSDWWAVGVLLYELITGRRPYAGPSIRELLAQHRDEARPPVDEGAPDLDPGWSALVGDLLRPDPAERLADGDTVLERLRALGRAEEHPLTEGPLVESVREAVARRAEQRPSIDTAPSTMISVATSLPHHHLPAERDAFVGREQDLAELERCLESGARLVTVLGTGGTGKTRLVVHHGWASLRRWPGGVWFCDLSDATTLDGIVLAVSRALDVPVGREPVAQLGHAIAGRGACLVILDNFEQVAEHANETLGRWLDRADQARFIATTRQVLGLRGEQSVALGPLAQSSAEALFALRAQAAKRGFALAESDHATVRDLVHLLDGLPLAIELAAARVVVMSPARILERMADRFRLLASRGAGRGRQATLRGAIDWSWDLLSDAEKSGLAQLSAFDGGFTLESAEAVLDLSAFPDAPWPMDVVQALVEKSLIRPAGEDRFDLFASIHAYAAEKLREPASFAGSGPEAERATWARHWARFAEHGTDEAIEALYVHGGVARRAHLDADVENLATACRRARDADPGASVALLRAAWEALRMRGPLEPAVALATEVLARADLEFGDQARATLVAGWAADLVGSMAEAQVHSEAGLALCRTHGDRRMEGKALWYLGIVHLDQGRLDEARASFEGALALVQEVGDRRYERRVRNSLGVALAMGGHLDEAGRHFEVALGLSVHEGDLVHKGVVLGNLGELALVQGRFEDAEWFLEGALEANREASDHRTRGISLGNLGDLRHRQGRLDEAREVLAEGERLLREVGNLRQLGMVRTRQGIVEHGAGDLAASRAALGHAEAIAARLGAAPESDLGQRIERLRALLD